MGGVEAIYPENYSACEILRNGRRVEIRALRATDRSGLEDAIDKTSVNSLYRRFFTVKKVFTEEQAQYFVNVDFKKHVALVAEVDQGGRPTIVGGGRYVVTGADTAEIAFTIIDSFQHQGLGTMLLSHLTEIARAAGLRQFIAEVLPDNAPMLKLFEKSGLHMHIHSEPEVVHVKLDLQVQ